jgi:hypothetical protein
MGGKKPETCLAVNKRQDNNLKNCCIWLVIYLNCTMLHGLTNLNIFVFYSLHFLARLLLLLSDLINLMIFAEERKCMTQFIV